MKDSSAVLELHKKLGVKGGPARATYCLLNMLKVLGVTVRVYSGEIAADAYTHRSKCMNTYRAYYWSTY